jgi:hypothetical protein
MPRPKVYDSAADRQAAYRERVRERENDEARIAYEARQQIPHALDELDSVIAYGARLGDGDCLTLEKQDRAGRLRLLAQWLKADIDRDADERQAKAPRKRKVP